MHREFYGDVEREIHLKGQHQVPRFTALQLFHIRQKSTIQALVFKLKADIDGPTRA